MLCSALESNDNSGNPYLDVFWLAALVDPAGELEFGQQSIPLLRSLLKRVDRILQFERLMPSYNGVLAISCIRTLNRVATKFSEYIPFVCLNVFLILFSFFGLYLDTNDALFNRNMHRAYQTISVQFIMGNKQGGLFIFSSTSMASMRHC
ncbi:Transcription initiation factor TFIID subunit 2-like protein [Drosera capensis]